MKKLASFYEKTYKELEKERDFIKTKKQMTEHIKQIWVINKILDILTNKK